MFFIVVGVLFLACRDSWSASSFPHFHVVWYRSRWTNKHYLAHVRASSWIDNRFWCRWNWPERDLTAFIIFRVNKSKCERFSNKSKRWAIFGSIWKLFKRVMNDLLLLMYFIVVVLSSSLLAIHKSKQTVITPQFFDCVLILATLPTHFNKSARARSAP